MNIAPADNEVELRIHVCVRSQPPDAKQIWCLIDANKLPVSTKLTH